MLSVGDRVVMAGPGERLGVVASVGEKVSVKGDRGGLYELDKSCLVKVEGAYFADPFDQDVLYGPGGFECSLGEPEDRIWSRDLQLVVKELNRVNGEATLWLSVLEKLRKVLEEAGADVNKGTHPVLFEGLFRKLLARASSE